MPTQQPATISGTLTPSDYVRFYYTYCSLLAIPAIASTAFGIFGLLTVLSTGDPDRWVNPGQFYVILICLGLGMMALPYWAGKSQFQRLKYLSQPMNYRFTETGMEIDGANFSLHVTWPQINKVEETKSAFLIYPDPPSGWVLPKSFFANSHEMQNWKAFTISHLSKPGLFRPAGLVGSKL